MINLIKCAFRRRTCSECGFGLLTQHDGTLADPSLPNRAASPAVALAREAQRKIDGNRSFTDTNLYRRDGQIKPWAGLKYASNLSSALFFDPENFKTTSKK